MENDGTSRFIKVSQYIRFMSSATNMPDFQAHADAFINLKQETNWERGERKRNKGTKDASWVLIENV